MPLRPSLQEIAYFYFNEGLYGHQLAPHFNLKEARWDGLVFFMVFKKVALNKIELRWSAEMFTVSLIPIWSAKTGQVQDGHVDTWTWRPYVMTVLVNPLQTNGRLLFPRVAIRLKLCQDHMGPTRTPLRCPPLSRFLLVRSYCVSQDRRRQECLATTYPPLICNNLRFGWMACRWRSSEGWWPVSDAFCHLN